MPALELIAVFWGRLFRISQAAFPAFPSFLRLSEGSRAERISESLGMEDIVVLFHTGLPEHYRQCVKINCPEFEFNMEEVFPRNPTISPSGLPQRK